MISEQFMQLGRWDLRLSPDTPISVRQNLVEYSSMLVTPTRVPHYASSSMATMAALARYRGPLLNIGADALSIGGHGMQWYLTDASDNAIANVPTPVVVRDWGQHLNNMTAGFTASGLTKATPKAVPSATWPNTGGTSNDLPGDWYGQLDFLAGALGCEWYIDTEANFRSGGAETSLLWTTTPTVVAQRGREGRDLDLIGMRLIEIGRERDVSTRLNQGVVYDTPAAGTLWGTYTDSSTEPRMHNAAATAANRTGIEFSSTIDNATDGAARAQAIAYEHPIHDVVSLSIDTYDPGRWIKPGDFMWCYDPINGVYDDTEATTYQGQHITPAKLRLFGMDWPVRQGMGVYIVNHVDGISTVHDLTDYVIFEESPVRLDVGGRSRSYDQ